MSEEPLPQSEIILYQTEDGRTRIQCRFENETLWLTQAQIAELFQTTPQNVTLHLRGIFAEGELVEAATCKDYLQVRLEGGREVSRSLRHYRLEAILAVGFRVRSHRGTQFRQWATARLGEYLLKGFTMDDERLKNPPGKGQKDYFDEQLERIRDIRSSERRFYQKVLDVYATSVDYTPNTEISQQFFATVQNKMHWAAHGQTAAEVIHDRVDAAKPFMGLQTTRPGGIIRKEDVSIAKNYLAGEELDTLNRIVTAYIEFAAQGQRQLRLGAALHPPPRAAGHGRLERRPEGPRQWPHVLQPVRRRRHPPRLHRGRPGNAEQRNPNDEPRFPHFDIRTASFEARRPSPRPALLLSAKSGSN